MGSQHTWMSAGSGGSGEKSMHAMNYGKQYLLLGRPLPVHVYAYYSSLRRHLARRIGVFQTKYNLPEQMRLVAGLEIGAERGQCESDSFMQGEEWYNYKQLSLSWRLRGNDGYRVSYRGWAERSKKVRTQLNGRSERLDCCFVSEQRDRESLYCTLNAEFRVGKRRIRRIGQGGHHVSDLEMMSGGG